LGWGLLKEGPSSSSYAQQPVQYEEIIHPMH